MVSQPTLAHASVVLRPWRGSDAEDLYREIQDPEIVRWFDIELPYTLQDADSFIAKTEAQNVAADGAHFVITNNTEDFVGYVGVLPVDPPASGVEIVYWVAADHRRQGYARHAVEALLPWIPEAFPNGPVEIAMTSGNEASAQVARAAGFRLHTTMRGAARLDGETADVDVYLP